jgi:hypothetical protein
MRKRKDKKLQNFNNATEKSNLNTERRGCNCGNLSGVQWKDERNAFVFTGFYMSESDLYDCSGFILRKKGNTGF